MATAADITRLRRLADAADTTAYPSEDLAARIDTAGSVEKAAAELWREKAAGYATLVDTTEGSSSRKMSQLHANALAMAKQLEAAVPGVVVDAGARPRSRAIVRG